MAAETKLTLLVADNSGASLDKITGLLKKQGHKVLRCEESGEVIESLKHAPVDAVLAGIKMPALDGLEVYKRIASAYPLLPIIILTPVDTIASAMEAVQTGAANFMVAELINESYLSFIINKAIACIRAAKLESNYKQVVDEAVKNKTAEFTTLVAQAKLATREMVQRLLMAAEFRDDETGLHVKRIAMYSTLIAAAMNQDTPFKETIAVASSMHDIGKIGIPDSVLLKTSGLTAEEFETMKKHTEIGHKIMKDSSNPYLKMAATISLTHHERWDGSGYPQGLKGEAIPLEGRIVNICDQYDALRSKRPHKEPFDHQKTFEILTKGDGRTKPEHFDPAVLSAFVKTAPLLEKAFDTNAG
ncbi:MAG: HD domain-containing protein [Chitinispirillaceae bacterium]|jgi:putative two-component system response regulator|nr:HD domain-containing protein [Chitinispirillaceae bacterium]